MRRKAFCGSFTVEAAIVMPITLYIIFAIIEFSFYLHDICVTQAVTNQAVVELSHIKESGGVLNLDAVSVGSYLDQNLSMLGLFISKEEESYIKEQIQSALEDKLYLCLDHACELENQYQKVSVKVKLDFGDSILGVLIPRKRKCIVASSRVYDPCACTRAGRLIYEEFRKTKIFEKVNLIIQKVREYIE